MTEAGRRVQRLWLEATEETIEADWAEAQGLAGQLDENEAGYLEGLAIVRDVLLRRAEAGRADSHPRGGMGG